MILQIPDNAKTYQLTNSTIWFDEEGILYSQPNDLPDPDLGDEEIMKEMEKFRAVTGNKKVCMIAEAHPKGGKPPKKEQRALIARELSTVTKAMAIITTSALSRMIINLFFGFRPPDYPVKMFKNEQDAKDWIRKYL